MRQTYCQQSGQSNGFLAVFEQRGRQGPVPAAVVSSASYTLGSGVVQPQTRSFDIMSGQGGGAVVGNKMAREDYIAVNLDDIIARAVGYTFVAHHGKAEALVGLPQMHYRHRATLSKVLNQHGGVIGGAVVADYDFVGYTGLPEHRVEAYGQSSTAVVGRYDERNCQ